MMRGGTGIMRTMMMIMMKRFRALLVGGLFVAGSATLRTVQAQSNAPACSDLLPVATIPNIDNDPITTLRIATTCPHVNALVPLRGHWHLTAATTTTTSSNSGEIVVTSSQPERLQTTVTANALTVDWKVDHKSSKDSQDTVQTQTTTKTAPTGLGSEVLLPSNLQTLIVAGDHQHVFYQDLHGTLARIVDLGNFNTIHISTVSPMVQVHKHSGVAGELLLDATDGAVTLNVTSVGAIIKISAGTGRAVTGTISDAGPLHLLVHGGQVQNLTILGGSVEKPNVVHLNDAAYCQNFNLQGSSTTQCQITTDIVFVTRPSCTAAAGLTRTCGGATELMDSAGVSVSIGIGFWMAMFVLATLWR